MNLTKLIYKLFKNLNFDNYFLTFHCSTFWHKMLKNKRDIIIQVNNFDWDEKLRILFERRSQRILNDLTGDVTTKIIRRLYSKPRQVNSRSNVNSFCPKSHGNKREISKSVYSQDSITHDIVVPLKNFLSFQLSPAFKALSTVCRGHSAKIVRSFEKEATKRLGISLDDHFGTNGNLVSAVGRGSDAKFALCTFGRRTLEERMADLVLLLLFFFFSFFFHVPCAPLIGPTQISLPPLPTKTLESDDSLKRIPRTLRFLV